MFSFVFPNFEIVARWIHNAAAKGPKIFLKNLEISDLMKN